MSVISAEIISAIKNRRNLRKNNTSVTFDDGVCKIRLHGNLICQIFPNTLHEGSYTHAIFDTCGWSTRTTFSRLNAIALAFNLPYSFHIMKGNIYYGEKIFFMKIEIPIPV